MKKFILLLTTVLTLAFAASCFATENSSALNDAEGSAQKVITALVASDTLGYKDAEKAMSADLAKQMNVNTFIAMQRQVQEKFGKHKETKFFSFERFDKADRLTYIAGFSKEPAVSIVFTLDKKGKITEFSLAALEVQQNEEQYNILRACANSVCLFFLQEYVKFGSFQLKFNISLMAAE